MKKLIALLVLIAGGGYFWYILALQPVDVEDTKRVTARIEQGWSTQRIAEYLYQQNLIRSPFVFQVYTKIHGLDSALQAGTYILNKSHSVGELSEILQTGRAEEVSVTIPEGYTVKDIDVLLSDIGVMDTGEFIRCANECDFSSYDFLPEVTEDFAERGGRVEGYLYPDTYFVQTDGFVPKFFIERMLNTFRSRVVEGLSQEISSSPYSLHEIVTMASLVEKEAVTDDERPVIAGILWKRYDADWGLGVDAAVRYIANKPTADITHADLNMNSPYNLRKFRGLTPAPIANAGLESIDAVLRPQTTQYWYYLHDKTGQVHYSVTNEEHNTKRYQYLGSGAGQ